MPTLNELLHAASRTFALGIDLLPEPLRGEVEIAYLLLRVSDYLEDNSSMEPDQKVKLLELWAAVLGTEAAVDDFRVAMGPVGEPTPDALVARSVEQVFRAWTELPRPEARAILARHVRDSTLGMARWAERGPVIADESDLDDYMHEVAGRVGWMLTELFALDVPAVSTHQDEMMKLGREFGLALQTVNVIRGLHSDWQRGWVYVPASFAGKGANPGLIFAGGDRDPALEAAVLARMVTKAEAHLNSALGYIERLPARARGVRLFCLLPYFFAVRTLALSRGSERVFVEEVKIPRREIRQITRAASLLGWSNRWVRWYAGRLASPRGSGPRSPDRTV